MPRVKIFISYRREDTRDAVRSLSSALRQKFGEQAVFVDTEEIEAGARWPRRIDRALKSAEVMLVAMGARWLDVKDEKGRPRIGQRGDWVRREIIRAIQRRIPVVPLLIDIAKCPAPLPNVLADLSDYQSFPLRGDHWKQDVAALATFLEESGVPPGQPRIVLMDTWAKIYDRNGAPGEMNAHVIQRQLQGLPVDVDKIEPVYSGWQGQDGILRKKPDLIIIHYSCLGDNDDPRQLRQFVERIIYTTERTKIIVYSRTNARSRSTLPASFVRGMQKFVRDYGHRVFTLPVYRGHQTFDDPVTSRALRALVRKVLMIEA